MGGHWAANHQSPVHQYQSAINQQSAISNLQSEISPTEYVAFPTRIGAAAQRARFRVDADGDDARAHGVGTEHAEHVAARSQVVEHLRRHASFDLELARRAVVVVERAVRVIRVEAWR